MNEDDIREMCKYMDDIYDRFRQLLSINDKSTPDEIGKCFAKTADHLINQNILLIDKEQYRIMAVEFFFFNPLHLDFCTFLLSRDDYRLQQILTTVYYGITIPFLSRPSSFEFEDNACFGCFVITDIALMHDNGKLSEPLSTTRLLKRNSFEGNEKLCWDGNLSKFSMSRKPRKCDAVKFDDIYECVRLIKKNVKNGKYSRKEIADALAKFQNKRYRFEMFTRD